MKIPIRAALELIVVFNHFQYSTKKNLFDKIGCSLLVAINGTSENERMSYYQLSNFDIFLEKKKKKKVLLTTSCHTNKFPVALEI